MNEIELRRAQEELLILEEEAAKRKADDPWWQWNPSPWQGPFVKDVLTGQVEEAWAFCANRTGKSDACAWIGASLARYGQQCPRFDSPNPLVFDGPTTGWIVSTTQLPPEMELLEENITALRERLAAPCWGVLPCGEEPAHAEQLGQALARWR